MNCRTTRRTVSIIGPALFLMLGCGGSDYMRNATTILQPDEQHAVVTFVRPSAFAFAIEVSMWDGEHFFGMLNSKKVLSYKAAPGEHLFVAHADNWSYLKANLEAGKHYYVVAKMFPGKKMFFGIGVALNPVLKDGEVTDAQIDNWV